MRQRGKQGRERERGWILSTIYTTKYLTASSDCYVCFYQWKPCCLFLRFEALNKFFSLFGCEATVGNCNPSTMKTNWQLILKPWLELSTTPRPSLKTEQIVRWQRRRRRRRRQRQRRTVRSPKATIEEVSIYVTLSECVCERVCVVQLKHFDKKRKIKQ